ncbi:MAG: class I SAM-dependent rRNA methyltransferase [Armatimonadetes bacterium]|nr:class I SAM-dependent rRNA methyltransferase [Armatimonadota bacterium]
MQVRRDQARSLDLRHPWVYLTALRKPPKNLPPGSLVDLTAEDGRFLVRGYFNDQSQIAVRVLTFDPAEVIDAGFFGARLAAAHARRAAVRAGDTTAWRLCFAEADLLPGLIVDVYGEWVVTQLLTAGMEAWRPVIVAALAKLLAPRGIFDRSDGEDRRRHEGLEPHSGVAYGEEPPAEVEYREHGRRFLADLRGGHKTGAYLDQRDNRLAVAAHAAGRRVLNAFAFTGGFGLYTATAGAAEVVHVDSSAPALELCLRNLALNGIETGQELCCDNVFDALRRFRQEGRRFDLVILDPPKFAAGRAQVDRALRGYRDLNQHALRLLEPGGMLATFSCSGAVDAPTFQKTLAGAALSNSQTVQIVQTLGQPADHPLLLSFPEGAYLKGLVLRVVS